MEFVRAMVAQPNSNPNTVKKFLADKYMSMSNSQLGITPDERRILEQMRDCDK